RPTSDHREKNEHGGGEHEPPEPVVLNAHQVVLHVREMACHDDEVDSQPIRRHGKDACQDNERKTSLESVAVDLAIEDGDCKSDDEEVQTTATACDFELARRNLKGVVHEEGRYPRNLQHRAHGKYGAPLKDRVDLVPDGNGEE